MKLKKDFITQMIGGTQMMVSMATGADAFKGLVKSNKTAAFIIDNLKQETTAEKITEAMLDVYEVDRDTAYNAVCRVIEQLRGIGAIEE